MKIAMTGIDHTAASVGIRSVFTYRQREIIDLMAMIKEETSADGIVLLTTCNRTELYVSGGDADAAQLTALLCRQKGEAAEKYGTCFTQRSADEAVWHLFALSAGLESAIVAEDQILSQVKDALSFAREAGFTDPVLEILFRSAVSAAKRVKSEVVFSYADRTAIDAALLMLSADGFDPAGKKCMVIGNGAYGRLAAETLSARGADVTMTIRQYHSGMVMIPEGCRKILYGEKMRCFPQCDLVISATKSPNFTLYYDQVAACRIDHEMVLIDFAVPRDIDPKIREIPGIRVYTIDDFQTAPNPENDAALDAACGILREAQADFNRRMNRSDLLPAINRIGEAAAADARFRLRKDVRKTALSLREQEELKNRAGDVTGKIVEKLLFRLRDQLDEETLRRCIGILDEVCAGEEDGSHAAADT